MYRLLAADIGGTNSRFALFRVTPASSGLPSLKLIYEKWLATREFTSFASLLAALMADAEWREHFDDKHPAVAAIAPAGPIEGYVCRPPNIPWIIEGAVAAKAFGIDNTFLLNDFAAQGYACLLAETARHSTVLAVRDILPGWATPGTPIAVTGAGSGFGKALVLPARALGESPRVLPSEGGHAEFPFVGKEEFAFAAFAAPRCGASGLIGDMVVSGGGLARLFAFFTGEEATEHEASARAHEHPKVLEWFARFYGRMCRNFVLDTLALGGLYITGGMALRVPVLTHPAFAASFQHCPAQAHLLRNVPVKQLSSHQAGLWGAALFGALYR